LAHQLARHEAKLADAYASDMARFAELEDIVALRRHLSSPDKQ